jgi:hypothetical protein
MLVPDTHSGKCDVMMLLKMLLIPLVYEKKIRLLEIVPDIQQICTGTATCVGSTRNNSRPSDIPAI